MRSAAKLKWAILMSPGQGWNNIYTHIYIYIYIYCEDSISVVLDSIKYDNNVIIRMIIITTMITMITFIMIIMIIVFLFVCF